MTGRIVAILVMLGAVVLVAYHHRDVFTDEPEVAASPEDAAFQACFTERSADIDKMVSDGVIGAEQAELFKSRAQAMCRDLAGQAQ